MADRRTPYAHLFQPGAIGRVVIRNRLVQLPMGLNFQDEGRVSHQDTAIQQERARNGVGLIITGGAIVHETSQSPLRSRVEAWNEDVRDSLRQRVEVVHAHGGRIFGQLVHLGRESPGGMNDTVNLAPSSIATSRDPSVPHEMTASEVRVIVDSFGLSAFNFQQAGYDGVEIHAAHGYLVAQFLSPASNRRVDAYRGDTLDGRARFLIEILEEIRARCGDDFPVGARLSADEQTADGLTLDHTLELIDLLQERSPTDYLSITAGMRSDYVKDSSWDEGFAVELAHAVRQGVDVPVIVAGRIRHPELAERIVAEGKADFVGMGRAFLADPEWTAKAVNGEASRIRPCIGIVQDCRLHPGGVACAVNARLGRETEWKTETHPIRRRVVVVGGGAAGLETARLAAEAGHEVVLFERNETPGGQLKLAAAGPTREEILDFVFYLEREVHRVGVDVRLCSEATVDAVLAESPDVVVCATGATALAPELPTDGSTPVITVTDLLSGSLHEVPARALVLDDGSGYWPGVSAAEFLAERGTAVELVTPARGIALAIPHESAAGVLRRLRGNGVWFRSLSTIVSVADGSVELKDIINGESDTTIADIVVVQTPMRSEDWLVRELDGRVAVFVIGDCAAPRRLSHAVRDAELAVRRLAAEQLPAAATALLLP